MSVEGAGVRDGSGKTKDFFLRSLSQG